MTPPEPRFPSKAVKEIVYDESKDIAKRQKDLDLAFDILFEFVLRTTNAGEIFGPDALGRHTRNIP